MHIFVGATNHSCLRQQRVVLRCFGFSDHQKPGMDALFVYICKLTRGQISLHLACCCSLPSTERLKVHRHVLLAA